MMKKIKKVKTREGEEAMRECNDMLNSVDDYTKHLFYDIANKLRWIERDISKIKEMWDYKWAIKDMIKEIEKKL